MFVQHTFDKIEAIFIMIQSMAEGHLLKSSGQVTCQGQQMFYQLLLNDTQYMIKFYDSFGKVRVIRPILLPAQNVEIHGIGEYLLCYETLANTPNNGRFYLSRLSNLRVQTQRLPMNLRCSHQQKINIKSIFCSVEKKIIIFSDIEENVYILTVQENEFDIDFLCKHDQEISEISLTENDEVVIINKNGGMSILQLKEPLFEVKEKKDEPSIIKYYRGDGFIVHYTKKREWRDHQSEEDGKHQSYFLLINNQNDQPTEFIMDKFYFEFSKESQILIKSGKNYIIVFNKTQNIILSVYNGLQRVNQITDKLMSEIEENNFLVNFKTDQSYNVLLEIRVFAKISQKFTLYQYDITRKDGNLHKSYLKKNLHNIYQFNGLILPHYEKEVQKALNGFINSLKEFENSKDSKLSEENMNWNSSILDDTNPYELGVSLLKISFQHFPSSLDRLVRKIKSNVQFNKTICYVQEVYRFFEYCNIILEDFIDSLLDISITIEREVHSNNVLKSKEKDELQRIKDTLENMISFLFGLINSLKMQADDDLRSSENNQLNEKQQKKFQYYEYVYNVARSFFAIVKMLEDQEILVKFEERFDAIDENRKKFHQRWINNNQLLKLNYRPLFLHEHFSMINLLMDEQKLTFSHLIKFMLANRQKFFENAYFYQSITKNTTTPYLESDVCDLIENICFHLPLMKESNLCQQQHFVERKNLLYKMTGTTLRLRNYPFLKYVLQLNICYNEFSLAIMLIFSQCYNIPRQFEAVEKQEHLFVIKSLILANRIDLAQVYSLQHEDADIFEQFMSLARINGNIPEVLELYDKKFILTGDQERLRQLLEIDERKWSILFGESQSQPMQCKQATDKL